MNNKCAGCEALKEAATTQLPRPIEPGEIRVGDRVRSEHTNASGTKMISEFDVKSIDGHLVIDPDGWVIPTFDKTFTLLSRPTPAPAVGSRWHSRERHTSYVYHRDDFYTPYNGESRRALLPNDETDAAIIVRLTPIPDHGDGCSPWLWDPEADTGWVESAVPGGTRMCVQVYGRLFGDGVAAHGSPLASRLRPWSERGQA